MIEVPNLDTIAFEQLVDEGRGLIPRYAPEWTDHNLHDPGMTLLDLLAWFVDQQVYRIGFVGDAHLAAFAALLGVKPRGAVPARGLIWPRAAALKFAQPLPARTRAHPIDQPELAFSTTHDIQLSAARIDRIEAQGGEGRRRIRPDEAGAVLLDPDTDLLELQFDRPLVPRNGEATPFALGLAYGGPLPALGGRAPVSIDYRAGGGIWHGAAPAWTGADDGAAGAILFQIPAAHGEVTALRLDLDTGLPRRLLPVRIALDAIPIVQIEELTGLKIGEGNGWPDLVLDLLAGTVPDPDGGFRPLAVTSVRGVEEPLRWQAVRDFSRSGPADPHFVFDQDRGSITFGNGVNGRTPPAGHQISRGPIDVTLGVRGNLAAGVDWVVSGLEVDGGSAFGANPDAVSGGSNAWSREDLLAELRARARLRQAMLTDEELIGAANDLEGFGIERAEVLARFWPALPGHPVPGARTLLLRPGRGVEASDAWLDAIESALAPRRVLGEKLAIAAADIVEVDVEAALLVAAGSDRARIRAEAEQCLRERLAVARRRIDQEIEPWPSGRPVTIAELETLLASVDGVLAVIGLGLAPAAGTPARMSLPLARTEVAQAADIVLAFQVEG